jgi:hypothetical protein
MKKTKLIHYILACVFLLGSALAGTAQQKVGLPTVSFAEVPLYPPIARVANVSGTVHVVVTTDGHRVVSTHVQDGPKVLSDAAEQNVKTWQFGAHEPTSFTVAYVYRLVKSLSPQRNNPRVILQLPTEIEIDALRWPGTKDMAPTLKPQSAP